MCESSQQSRIVKPRFGELWPSCTLMKYGFAWACGGAQIAFFFLLEAPSHGFRCDMSFRLKEDEMHSGKFWFVFFDLPLLFDA